MRPAILNPLFAPATVLPGVGVRTAAAYERLAGPLVVHLLWHLPSGLIDRRHAPKVAEAEAGATATLTVRVDRHQPAPDRRRPAKVYCSDETGNPHPRLLPREGGLAASAAARGLGAGGEAGGSSTTAARSRWRIPTTSRRWISARACRRWSPSIR